MSFIFLIPAYLLGSIPFGFIIAKGVKQIDIREYGSGNIGATNVGRVIGKNWGIFVFLLDVFKGYAAIYLPLLFSHPELTRLPFNLGLAAAAILGHTFPIWLSFKGGKGVAVSLGVFLAAAPKAAWSCFAAWIAVFIFTHIISIASLVAAIIFPLLCFSFYHETPGFMTLFGISLILACFIFYTHRANIGRILRGQEKKIF